MQQPQQAAVTPPNPRVGVGVLILKKQIKHDNNNAPLLVLMGKRKGSHGAGGYQVST